MYLKKLLEIIQAQRHDFLNHFQVISGLLQLNKIDRVREYIGQVSMEMVQFSKTAKVNVPEVTAALLAAFHDASMSHIELELTVETDLRNCRLPGPVLGEVLLYCQNLVISSISSPEAVEERLLEIILTENDKNYVCRFIFPEIVANEAYFYEKGIITISKMINPYGGRINFAVTNNKMEIFLYFPRNQAKSG